MSNSFDKKHCIVVTTINYPNKAMISLAKGVQDKNWLFIVVGDEKSPNEFHLNGAEYLSLDNQFRSGFKISKLLPTGHYARKNIGYLQAIKLGAKVIWMPSLDSSQTYRVNKKDPKKGLSILEGGLEGDKLLPVMKEIFKLIAQSDVILDTGHLSPKESLLLIDEAKKYGVKKILINHPNGISVRASIDEQKEMARKGA